MPVPSSTELPNPEPGPTFGFASPNVVRMTPVPGITLLLSQVAHPAKDSFALSPHVIVFFPTESKKVRTLPSEVGPSEARTLPLAFTRLSCSALNTFRLGVPVAWGTEKVATQNARDNAIAIFISRADRVILEFSRSSRSSLSLNVGTA